MKISNPKNMIGEELLTKVVVSDGGLIKGSGTIDSPLTFDGIMLVSGSNVIASNITAVEAGSNIVASSSNGVLKISANVSAITINQQLNSASTSTVPSDKAVADYIDGKGIITELPLATSQSAGIVKVGSGLTVTSDGTLNAIAQEIVLASEITNNTSNAVSGSVIKAALDGKINRPSNEGTNGQVLKTSGNGTTYWGDGGVASTKGGDSTVTVTAGQTTNATCYFLCLVEGTKIRLANGKDKNVEDIEYDDELLVWDFDNGCYASAKPIWIKQEEIADEYLLSTYSNGIQLKTVGTWKHHEAFDLDNQEFNYIDDIVGHSVATLDGIAKCLSCKIVKENVKFYNVITDGHFNLYANGILTSCSLNKLYKVKDMTYVKDARNLASREEYDGIPEKYIAGLRLLEQPTNKKKYVERLINNEKQQH